MFQTGITNDPALPASPPRATRRLRIPALLLIVGCALICRVAHDRMANRHDALHGNMEEAQEQLSPVIERLPAGERVPQLLRYADDPSPGLRFAALNLLGDQQDPRVGDALERAYRDSDSEVRKLALLQLWHADLKRGTHLLLCGLHDDDTWLREAAIMEIKALVKGKPRKMDGKVVPNLIAALDDPDDTLPQTATNLLRTLTGHRWYALHRDTPQRRQAAIAQWKRWWAGAGATWPTTPEYTSAGPILPTRADPGPEFALSTLDGRSISLSGQKGRITLLEFWSVGLPACMADAVTLATLDRRYRDRQVDIVGVQMGFPRGSNEVRQIDQLRAWCHAHGVDYAQTLINPGTLEAFGDIHDIPVTVLLDRQGRIRYRWDGGPREPEVFAAAIERLLKE